MSMRMNCYATLYSQTRISYSGGTYTTSWMTLSNLWCNIQQARPELSIIYQNDKLQQYDVYTVRIRNSLVGTLSNITISVNMLIKYRGLNLRVLNVADPSQNKSMLQLMCKDENTLI